MNEQRIDRKRSIDSVLSSSRQLQPRPKETRSAADGRNGGRVAAVDDDANVKRVSRTSQRVDATSSPRTMSVRIEREQMSMSWYEVVEQREKSATASSRSDMKPPPPPPRSDMKPSPVPSRSDMMPPPLPPTLVAYEEEQNSIDAGDDFGGQYMLTKETSFAAWKQSLYQELKELKCLFTIEPSAARKKNMSNDDEMKYRSLAKAIICMRIDDDHLPLVANVEDPLRVMKILNELREPNDQSFEIDAMEGLNSLAYDPKLPVDQFVAAFENQIEEVEKCIGERVDDARKKEYLVATLAAHLPNLLAGSNKSSYRMSFDELKRWLVNRAGSESDAEDAGCNVDLASQIEEDARIQKLVDAKRCFPLKETKCNKCSAFGHLLVDCKRTDRKRKCYQCLEFVDDHLASNCPSRHSSATPAPARPAGGATSTDSGRRPPSKSSAAAAASRVNAPMANRGGGRPQAPHVGEILEEPDSPDMDDMLPVGRLRQVLHIRRKLMARKLKTGRVPKSDLIFTDSDFYTDIEYREMFIEKAELATDDIVLETIQVMKTD